MERTETNISDASSIVGGEPIGEDLKRRVYGFNLPFSGQIPRRLTLPLHNLPLIGDKEPVEALSWSDPHDLKAEDEKCRTNYINPRTYVVKSQLEPRRPTFKDSSLPDIDGTVVVMGGYRGSTLRDTKTNRQVWIPFKVGLNLRKVDLELGLDDDSEWNAAESIYADGMLTHVGPIDISRKLLRRLKAQKSCRVFDWGYDWRLSCTYSSRKFIEYLKKLHMHDPRGAIIICHSMGGVVAHHALQQLLEQSPDQKLIRGIVYVGSPSDCVPVLGPLRVNDPVLLAKDILTPKVNFTMRSSFVFLPDDGKCFVNAEDPDTRYDLDYWNVETWIKYNLSPCVSSDPAVRKMQNGGQGMEGAELPVDEAVTYLKRTLARNREFRDSLKPIEGRKYPPMAVIYGNTLPTVVGAKVDDESGIHTTQFENVLYGAGDGVVFRKSLLPLKNGFDPEKYDIKVIPTKDGHIGLIANSVAIGEGLAHILTKEGKTPTFSPVKKKRFATARAKVHGINPFSKATGLFRRNNKSAASGTSTPPTPSMSTLAESPDFSSDEESIVDTIDQETLDEKP